MHGITQRNRAPAEKMIVVQLFAKFSAFCISQVHCIKKNLPLDSLTDLMHPIYILAHYLFNILRYRISQHLTFVASNHHPGIAATEVFPQQGESATYEPN
jgi:hypothetical protein